jgi:hypothetical protein
MIYTENLRFHYANIDFEATVRYSDLRYRETRYDKASSFWEVKLHKPEILECEGERRCINGLSSYWLASTRAGDRRFTYVPDPDYKEEEYETNVFPLAIEKILYCYFNRDKIDYYMKKVELFNEKLDKRYAPLIEEQREKRLSLRRKMRAGEITPKQYQKLYKPIRLKKGELESKVFWTKKSFKDRYFKCTELKNRYRDFTYEKGKRCLDSLRRSDDGWIVEYRDEESGKRQSEEEK